MTGPERAAWLGWQLAHGERIQPTRAARRLGIHPAQVVRLLAQLSRTLPIMRLEDGFWIEEVVMSKTMVAMRPEVLPADSELGRKYATWQAGELAAVALERAAGRLSAEYGQLQAELARATFETMGATEFALGTAKAELLRRGLPAAQAQATAARQRAEDLKASFSMGYQSYLRSVDARNKAVDHGQMTEVAALERALAAAVSCAV